MARRPKDDVMVEPRDNITMACAKHFPKIIKKTIKRLKELKINIEIGDQIKTTFEDGERSEHMWILVLKVDFNSIAGILKNDPVLVHNVKYGDKVKVDIDTITGYMSRDGKTVINTLYE